MIKKYSSHPFDRARRFFDIYYMRPAWHVIRNRLLFIKGIARYAMKVAAGKSQ